MLIKYFNVVKNNKSTTDFDKILIESSTGFIHQAGLVKFPENNWGKVMSIVIIF